MSILSVENDGIALRGAFSEFSWRPAARHAKKDYTSNPRWQPAEWDDKQRIQKNGATARQIMLREQSNWILR
jgi:hypothetical protein